MHFSSIYIGSLLLLSSNYVLGNPVPGEDGIPAPGDATVTTYEPLLIDPEELNINIQDTPLSPLSNAGVPDADTVFNKRWVKQLFTRAMSTDQAEAFRLHNAARTKKKLKPLVWDNALLTNAAAYAKVLAKSGKFAHSPAEKRVNQGENLAYASSSSTIANPITLGTKGWLSEEKFYKGEVIPKGSFSQYGHYTQIMWNTTSKVGIATASDGKGGWYTVARYSPPGNFINQKPY